MRAMVLRRPGSALELTDRPDPVPAADELLLDVHACAVCRTDLQIASGDLAARTLPIVPGHQAVGTVRAMGSTVTGWHVGDRAGVGWLGDACGHCDACRRGEENLCPAARFTGWDRDGGFAERMTVRAEFALRLPSHLASADAAPLLCGGIIGYRSLRLSGVTDGGRIGLFGFGASALLTLQVARHRGCEVHVIARDSVDRDHALSLGAAWAGDVGAVPPAPLDGAITFAPVGRIVVDALGAVRRGGTVAVNAIHLDGIPAFDYDLLWGERGLRSVANYTRADAAEFLELAGAIPIRPEIERFALEDANVALAAVAEGRVHGAAVLLMDR